MFSGKSGYLYVESKDKSLLEKIAVRALNSLCKVSLKDCFDVAIQITQVVINKICEETRPITILQLPKVINKNVYWPVYFKEYSWSSNGDLSKYESFRSPDTYLSLDIQSGKCSFKD